MRSLEEFINEMQGSDNYLKINELKDGFSYSIWARNAFAGVWIKSKSGFLISRYKVGVKPYLACEYHWDVDEVVGTAKPVGEIEKCPPSLLGIEKRCDDLLVYLDKLEEKNALFEDYNSVLHRKRNALKFQDCLAGVGERANMVDRKRVWEFIHKKT